MKAFSGHPGIYRRASWIMSLYLGLSIYTAFALIKYLVHGATWVFGWKPLLFTACFVLLFQRFSLRVILRLDGHQGGGKHWGLEPATVKLPQPGAHTPAARDGHPAP